VSTPSPRGRITGVLKRLLIWLLILGCWETAYRVIGWKAWLFPAPSQVIDSTLAMLNVQTAFGDPLSAHWPKPAAEDVDMRAHGSIFNSELVEAIATSGVRLIVGFSISIVFGAVLGILMWRFQPLDEFLGPLFLGFQTLPSVCWVPLAILTLGLNERGILFVLVMGSCFAIAIAFRDGLRTIPPIYRRAGHMLGARRLKMYRYVLLPASMPALSSSLRQGFSFAWRSLMGAELILFAERKGVGFLLEAGRNTSDVARVVAVLVVMVVIGMIVDRYAFANLERHVYNRFGLDA
jgi:NitT/TauT family transport system permease protein